MDTVRRTAPAEGLDFAIAHGIKAVFLIVGSRHHHRTSILSGLRGGGHGAAVRGLVAGGHRGGEHHASAGIGIRITCLTHYKRLVVVSTDDAYRLKGKD